MTIHARPERTTEDVERDEQLATEFWERLSRDDRRLRRLVERESYDYKLLMADKEGREWASRQAKNDMAHRTARRAARIVADPLADRRDENLRQFVSAEIRAQMPRIAMHGRAKGERAASLQKSYWWFYGLRNIGPTRRERILRDRGVVFEQWLLCNPQYGPERVGPDLFAHAPQTYNYIPGQIRPAGMSPERALQIALSVLDDHDGVWPDAPPQLL